MPIRFRCAYCNQLLGIARRKAGTVVRCPTCAGQVVVPPADAEGEAAPQDGPALEPVFERSDFDLLLNEADGSRPRKEPAPAPAPAAPLPGAWGTHAEPAFDVEPLGLTPDAAKPPGVVLTPVLATVLAVLVIVALALAFGAGLFVGRALGT